MKIKKIELNILLFILIEAFILLFFFKESFLTILLGTILGIALIFIAKKIKINKIIQLIILLTSLFLLLTTIYKINDFITFNLLKNYPNIIIIISFLLVSFYLASKGYHTYIKALELIFYIFIFIKMISIILIIPNIDITNFNNQLLTELKININFLYIGLFILFISLSIKYLTNHSLNIKNYLISSINPIFIKILSISVIGETLFNLYQYPYINVLKRIKYLDFIERMEGILSIEYFITFMFLLSFLILLIKDLLINLKKLTFK